MKRTAPTGGINGLSFETAPLVFDDPLAINRVDSIPTQTAGKPWEWRDRCFCSLSTPGLNLTPAGEETGRIISARRASVHERRACEKGDF